MSFYLSLKLKPCIIIYIISNPTVLLHCSDKLAFLNNGQGQGLNRYNSLHSTNDTISQVPLLFLNILEVQKLKFRKIK